MAVGRYWMDPRRIGQLVADHLVRDPLQVVAARYARSMTWVRDTLQRLGLPPRRGGGIRQPAATRQVARLRDSGCGSRAEVHQLRPRHRNAADTSGHPGRTHNRFGTSADEEARHRNDAINHVDEIRAAYWSGTTLEDLADQWRVSLKTITIWVYQS